VALSLVLLVGAGLLVRSFAQLAKTSLGFHSEHLLTGELQLPNSAYPPERRFQFFDGLREDLSNIPGVTAVGFIDKLPIKNPWGNYPLWAASRPPADPSLERSANVRLVLPGYLEAAGIPLLAGRTISRTDLRSAPPTVVIDERLAKTLFPGQNPIGQQLAANLGILSPHEPVNCEIVGIVGAARLDTVDDPGHMAIYLSYDQFMPRPAMYFVVRTAIAPQTVAASVRKTVAARDPNLPLGPLVTMDQVISDSLVSQRVTTITLTLFSTIAMLLAALGLYGTLAYWVNQRRQEMGIRVALGAERRDIVRLVVGHGMRLALLGAAIGIVGAFAVTRLMSTMIYGIGAHDPATFGGGIVLLVASAAMACLLPAWRATRVNPVETLRAE
jgi:predicted permease